MKNKFVLSSSICDLAESIAMSYDSLATPLEKVALDEEIPIILDDYSNEFDGMTVFDGKFYIHLNTSRGNYMDTARGRFTLAHEIAHCIIEKHRVGLMKGLLNPHPSKTNQAFHVKIEREADYFASCLLMPRDKFLKECFRKTFNFSLIKHLSNVFEVSLTAVALRFALIGNHPIMVVYSKGSNIEWYLPSEDFPFRGLINGRESIPLNSMMSDYFNNNIKDMDPTIVYAQDWFKIFRDEDKDREFFEKCIYGPDGVISIIWEE